MNIMIDILCVFALIGLADKFLGNKFGLAEEFDDGMKSFANMVISASGFYVFGISIVRSQTEFFVNLSKHLPFDASVLIGCILSSDYGAAPIGNGIALTPELGYFGGTMVASGLGMSISFLLPVFFTLIPKEDYETITRGLMCGVLTVPVGLVISGLMLGLAPNVLLVNMLPVLILCGVILVAFNISSEKTLQTLGLFGEGLRRFSVILFMIITASMFMPIFKFVDQDLLSELVYIVLRIMITCGGGMVAASLILKYMKSTIVKIADYLGMNTYSVIGLFLGAISSLAMLAIFSKMDRRGKIINIAFNICGSHIIGGQMVFIAGIQPSYVLTIYAINKIVCGILAVILAMYLNKKQTIPVRASVEV